MVNKSSLKTKSILGSVEIEKGQKLCFPIYWHRQGTTLIPPPLCLCMGFTEKELGSFLFAKPTHCGLQTAPVQVAQCEDYLVRWYAIL